MGGMGGRAIRSVLGALEGHVDSMGLEGFVGGGRRERRLNKKTVLGGGVDVGEGGGGEERTKVSSSEM